MTDFYVTNGGSIFTFEPNTDAAREWVDEHIGEDNGFQPYYPMFIVEPRFAFEIAEGILADGLTIQ